MGHARGVDTTVKSATGLWKAFAPTWTMVMGVKHGQLSHDDYTAQYHAMLAQVDANVWEALAQHERVTFLCYCRDGWFCHTHLLIDYAVAPWPERFSDGREDSDAEGPVTLS